MGNWCPLCERNHNGIMTVCDICAGEPVVTKALTDEESAAHKAWEPLKIDKDTLYPLEWLEERLNPVMSLWEFLTVLGLGDEDSRMFSNFLWGFEILRAGALDVSSEANVV